MPRGGRRASLGPAHPAAALKVTIDVSGERAFEALEAVVRQIDGEGVVMIVRRIAGGGGHTTPSYGSATGAANSERAQDRCR